jgi:hypothetical protein
MNEGQRLRLLRTNYIIEKYEKATRYKKCKSDTSNSLIEKKMQQQLEKEVKTKITVLHNLKRKTTSNKNK